MRQFADGAGVGEEDVFAAVDGHVIGIVVRGVERCGCVTAVGREGIENAAVQVDCVDVAGIANSNGVE